MEWVVKATPRPLYPRERPGTHCMGGWVGPSSGLDGCEPGFDPRTVQPVASRYTVKDVDKDISQILCLLDFFFDTGIRRSLHKSERMCQVSYNLRFYINP